jgi:hypothetical protein
MERNAADAVGFRAQTTEVAPSAAAEWRASATRSIDRTLRLEKLLNNIQKVTFDKHQKESVAV